MSGGNTRHREKSWFMDSNTINTIGLGFDLIGVVMLFIYANPFRGKSSYWTSDEMARKDELKENYLILRQQIGLGLIGIGFILQIISNYIK